MDFLTFPVALAICAGLLLGAIVSWGECRARYRLNVSRHTQLRDHLVALQAELYGNRQRAEVHRAVSPNAERLLARALDVYRDVQLIRGNA